MFIPEADLPKEVIPKDLYQLYMGLVGLVVGKSLDSQTSYSSDDLT